MIARQEFLLELLFCYRFKKYNLDRFKISSDNSITFVTDYRTWRKVMFLGNYIFNEDSIYDILNATVDITLLEKVAETKMEFKDSTKIILYTSLNATNTKLLQSGKYKDMLFAFEYEDMAKGIDQSEYIIQLSYDTKGLYDTMHPLAYKEIEQLIKATKNIKKSEVEDREVLRLLTQKYKNITGFRVHSINPGDKAYANTHIFFGESKVAYILRPECINVEKVYPLTR